LRYEPGSKDRYGQDTVVGGKLVPKVWKLSCVQSSVVNIVEQLVGGACAAVWVLGRKKYSGTPQKSLFIQITSAG